MMKQYDQVCITTRTLYLLPPSPELRPPSQGKLCGPISQSTSNAPGSRSRLQLLLPGGSDMTVKFHPTVVLSLAAMIIMANEITKGRDCPTCPSEEVQQANPPTLSIPTSHPDSADSAVDPCNRVRERKVENYVWRRFNDQTCPKNHDDRPPPTCWYLINHDALDTRDDWWVWWRKVSCGINALSSFPCLIVQLYLLTWLAYSFTRYLVDYRRLLRPTEEALMEEGNDTADEREDHESQDPVRDENENNISTSSSR